MTSAAGAAHGSAERLIVVGGGLAGCEAAWQAAESGVGVDLFEMRPVRSGPAHKTAMLAELVCSNSLRGASLENAVGLLKEELARMGSLIVGAARESAVPAGGALAVDRERFGALVERRLLAHPNVTVHREEVTAFDPERAAIVACGPLPSDALAAALDAALATAGDPGEGATPLAPAAPAARCRLHYYDAASPIVAADSLDESAMYRKSRYDKGDGDDYLNVPLDREAYLRLVHDLRELPKHAPKEFECDVAAGKISYFEGCLPVEELAARGDDALRYGPCKPVGLRDPRTGRTPYAVVQLRKENAAGTAYNLVGFQTRLTWPAQREAFGKLPGFANAEWLRLGVMHRNTFVDAPRLLAPDLRLRSARYPRLWLAGQITGAEGYVEAAACGLIAALAAARALRGLEPIAVPQGTALGAVVAHLTNTTTADFQPANVTWANFSEPDDAEGAAADAASAAGRKRGDKRERRRRMAEHALERIERFAELVGRRGVLTPA